jgi:FMN phosphatase YigB (HAD superfamily)
MIFKSLRIIALALICSGLQPVAAKTQKCVCFGIKGVLLYPDMHKVSGGGIGGMLGFTPEKVEKELFDTLEPLTLNNFPIWTRTYPVIIEAWLTGYRSNSQVHDDAHHYVKKHCGIMKAARLKTAVNIAFSDEQAKTFSAYSDSVSLAKRCKSSGNTIALCSSWNRESFNNLKLVQKNTLGIFDTAYISGYCGMLAATPTFYDNVINDYGVDNIVLVDCLPENIRAAKARGIKTIKFTSAAQAERELKALGFLS